MRKHDIIFLNLVFRIWREEVFGEWRKYLQGIKLVDIILNKDTWELTIHGNQYQMTQLIK